MRTAFHTFHACYQSSRMCSLCNSAKYPQKKGRKLHFAYSDSLSLHLEPVLLWWYSKTFVWKVLLEAVNKNNSNMRLFFFLSTSFQFVITTSPQLKTDNVPYVFPRMIPLLCCFINILCYFASEWNAMGLLSPVCIAFSFACRASVLGEHLNSAARKECLCMWHWSLWSLLGHVLR